MSTARHVSITPERKSTLWRKFSRFMHFRAFKTTFKVFLRVPITDLYHPAKDHSHYPAVNHRYRGLLALSYAACTGCKKCERICPNGTIIMETRVINGKEHRFPGYFAGRCMLCGLCEEVCDRQFAIRHTDQFEEAGYQREQLYFGPERMFEMWFKHIEPRIQAGFAHKAVPDKKRFTRENVHDLEAIKNAPKPEIPEKFQKRVEEAKADKNSKIPFNAPIGLWK